MSTLDNLKVVASELSRVTSDTSDVSLTQINTVEKKSKESFSNESINVFTNFLFNRFEFLNKLQTTENSFTIPANVLTTSQLQDLLNELQRFGFLESSQTHEKNLELLRTDPFLFDEIQTPEIGLEVVKLFKTLKEFLVVEYFHSLNHPVYENIVHNRKFSLQRIVDEYKTVLEFENWSGEEDQNNDLQDIELRDLDHWYLQNLQLEPDQARENLALLMGSFLELAKSIDALKLPITEDSSVFVLQHFDINPSNLFIRELIDSNTGKKKYSLVLGDFGLAALSTFPRTKNQSGTNGYVSPELSLRRFSNTISRSDVYSFAATVFTILIGGRPDTFSSPVNHEKKSFKVDTFPLEIDDEITRESTDLIKRETDLEGLIETGLVPKENLKDVINVLARGMSMYAQNRYASCTELMHDLMKFLDL